MSNEVTILLIGIIAGITFLNLGIALLVFVLHRKRQNRLRNASTEREFGTSYAAPSVTRTRKESIPHSPVDDILPPLPTPGPVPPSPSAQSTLLRHAHTPPDKHAYCIRNHTRNNSNDSSAGETTDTLRPAASTVTSAQYSRRSGRSKKSGRKKKHSPSFRPPLSVRSDDTESMYSVASAPSELHEMITKLKDKYLTPRLQGKNAALGRSSSGASTPSSVLRRANSEARLTMITEEMLAPEMWTGRSLARPTETSQQRSTVVTNQRPLSYTSSELKVPEPVLSDASRLREEPVDFLPTPESMRRHPFAMNTSHGSPRSSMESLSIVVPVSGRNTPATDIRDAFLFRQVEFPSSTPGRTSPPAVRFI